jgi:hypothetical protein
MALGAQLRAVARRVEEIYPRTLAAVMWRHPHPNPPPQAEEGAHRRCGKPYGFKISFCTRQFNNSPT